MQQPVPVAVAVAVIGTEEAGFYSPVEDPMELVVD